MSKPIYTYFIPFSPFLIFCLTYVTLILYFKVPEHTMPELVGLHLADGAKICSSLHLRLQILQSKEDDSLPDGTILQQIPAQGNRIKERQSVFIAISERKPVVACPSFIDLSQEEIYTESARIGLPVKIYSVSYSYPTNRCFSQWPSAGKCLHGHPIVCYIAKAKETAFVCPNFIGYELRDALELCRELGIQTQPEQSIHRGRRYIIDQSLKPGATIQESQIKQIIIEFKLAKRPALS